MTAPDIIGDAYGLRDADRLRTSRPLRERASRAAASGWLIGVIALALSAVLGTAIFAAVSLSGGGTQPEEVLPGSAFAFAKVDFDPPAGQKLAVRGLTNRFPDAPAEELAGLRDELIRSILEDGDVPLDFAKDIAPWLGDRVGVAAFLDAGGEPAVVFALQTSDADGTRRAITKGAAGDDVPAVAFRRGYALIAEDDDTLAEALASTDKGALSDDDRYEADRGAIADDQIVVGWADNKVLGQVFMGAMSEYSEGSDGDTLQDDVEDAFRGRTVLGLHAAPRHVELEVVTLDGAPGGGGAEPTTMQDLPDGTVAAVYVHNLARVAEDAGAALGALGAVGSSAFFPFFLYGGGLPGLMGGDLGEGLDVEKGEAMSGPPVQCVSPPADAGSAVPCDKLPPFVVPDDVRKERERRQQEARRRGEAIRVLTEELLPLLQGETTLSLLGVPDDDEMPAVGLTARVSAPGNSVSPLTAALKGLDLDTAAVTTAGDRLLAATDPQTLTTLKRGGSLGSTESFRAAMGELDGSVAAALYVSIDALEDVPDFPEAMRLLRAVGMVVTESPGRSSMRLRVVVDG